MAQQVKNPTQCPWGYGFNPWPGSVGLGSGIATSCGVDHRRGWDVVLPWLWHRPAAAALIWPLAWKLPYAPQGEKKPTHKTKHTNLLNEEMEQDRNTHMLGYYIQGEKIALSFSLVFVVREALLRYFRILVIQHDMRTHVWLWHLYVLLLCSHMATAQLSSSPQILYAKGQNCLLFLSNIFYQLLCHGPHYPTALWHMRLAYSSPPPVPSAIQGAHFSFVEVLPSSSSSPRMLTNGPHGPHDSISASLPHWSLSPI